MTDPWQRRRWYRRRRCRSGLDPGRQPRPRSLVYDGGSWQEFSITKGVLGPILYSVAIAPNGTVWIATDDLDHGVPDPGEDPNVPAVGVASFDGATWTTYTTADGLASNDGEVVVGSDGTVWVVHTDAVSRFDGDTWTTHEVREPPGGEVPLEVQTARCGWVPTTASSTSTAPTDAIHSSRRDGSGYRVFLLARTDIFDRRIGRRRAVRRSPLADLRAARRPRTLRRYRHATRLRIKRRKRCGNKP